MTTGEPMTEITLTLLPEVAARLAVLADEDGPGAAAAVLATLADHCQQAVYRPGSWERAWACQVFGDDWLARVEPDTGNLSAAGRVIFDRPRGPGPADA